MRALGVLVVAACSAPAHPAVSNAQGDEPVGKPPAPIVRAPRPQIDLSPYLPDFHDELRWPLRAMAHPKLEPSYAIANELAAPGIGWIDLCAVGAQSRRLSGKQELNEYLHGWCSVAKGDVDGACRYLRPLLGSMVLRDAVRVDLANILADQGDADKAEHWINKHHIVDIEVLDLLAANFVEIGQEADAATINRHAMDADSTPSAATKCRRLTRRIVLARDVVAFDFVRELEKMVRAAKVPDETCLRLWTMVSCWREPVKECAAYWQDEHINERQAQHLIDAYYQWPYEGSTTRWLTRALDAVDALPAAGADELAVASLEAARRAVAEDCPYGLITASRTAMKSVDADHQARLQAIITSCGY
jgi:hypothetical protein